MNEIVYSVSDFVAVFNQTLENAYPLVRVVGELAGFRISKNRWVYFDLKDENASVKFFGTVYQLPGPLEDGLMMEVTGAPRLHPLYGFSINVQAMRPVGEGSLKKAAALLEAKLRGEGLFEESRKRPLPFPPERIGLITSGESAAYYDFIKVISARWGGLDIRLADTQVQGEAASGQMMAALEYFNSHNSPVDVIVLTRGGGSAEDLAAFNEERLTRAIAASRIPTLVAVGHEVDVSLAELAADKRASAPSNAAELLVPDKRGILVNLRQTRGLLGDFARSYVSIAQTGLGTRVADLADAADLLVRESRRGLTLRRQVLTAFNPKAVLRRGYAILRGSGGDVIKSFAGVSANNPLNIELYDGYIQVTVDTSEPKSDEGSQ